MADATVSLNENLNVIPLPLGGSFFTVGAYSANWSTVGEVVAAVTGSTHYITKILIRSAVTCTVSLGSGTGSDAITTLQMGPIPMNAGSGVFPWKAPDGYGMKLTASTELALETAESAPLWIYVEGITYLG